ncbi:MAG: polysaccharide pyruvyl transferase CsaB [Pseudanabaenaceae cyanobacterium bins.39]|nr:polysaccharide pyruvyl transferase CsaB [Pseudanabaenaceae cyanobacterium bins.39]
MQRAVLCGYYGMGNGGDEALLATLLQMLPPHVQPLVLSADPRATEALHQVQASDRYSLGGILSALREADTFIWGGGSLMQDTTSARNPIYYGGLMGLAQGMGLRTIAWAQGVGPLRRGLSKWIARRAFGGCDVVSVRDRQSAELLASWQVRAEIAPDPVWAMQSEPVPLERDAQSPMVAVVLRSHPDLTSCRIATILEALQILQRRTDANILLIPFQPSQDLAIAKALCKSLNAKSDQNYLPAQVVTQTNPRRLKGLFQHVDLAIAMRLHGVIMALAEGCQCSALSYDPKVSYLMQDLALSGWELANLPEDAQAIADIWLQDLEAKPTAIAPRIQQLKEQAYIHQKALIPIDPS